MRTLFERDSYDELWYVRKRMKAFVDIEHTMGWWKPLQEGPLTEFHGEHEAYEWKEQLAPYA